MRFDLLHHAVEFLLHFVYLLYLLRFLVALGLGNWPRRCLGGLLQEIDQGVHVLLEGLNRLELRVL